ncbi:Aste57867_19432 [Aphanomyces stellatus]|uniref:Aste57867_19432 protein n=1 Tax=Aphanomyces stellatus TaxID=120398 RepID=A0A485LEH6_9STRA|nr:hypothetical protein As57867_019368 [Aphanomyces stellatus]VFT96146.1 Aste57867_19432 [Aphanomyces stellatus]
MNTALESAAARTRRWADSLNAREHVTLVVSGARFQVLRTTLTAARDSYFAFALAQGNDTDQLVLDLDPTHFHRILIFLRRGEFSFDGLDPWACRELRASLAFLNLDVPMSTKWAWMPTVNATGVSLTEGNTVLQTKGPSCGGVVMGDGAVTSFQLRLDDGALSGAFYIGFAPQDDSTLPINGANYPTQALPPRRGFYLRLYDGALVGPGDATHRTCAIKQRPGSLFGFILTVELRPDNSVHYQCSNVREHVVAFHVPDAHGPLYPTVCFRGCVTTVSIIT